MTPDKKRRIATAAGFLSGLTTCLDALREVKVFWPPNVVWEALRNPHRLELGGGVARIVVTLVMSLRRRKEQAA